MRGFSSFMSAIGATIIVASMLYALRSAAAPDGVLYVVGNVGFHLTVIGGLALILTPPIGSGLTLVAAEFIRRRTSETKVVSFLRALAAASWLALLVSVGFPFHATRVWGWPVWRTAYVYAAIVGVIFGALSMRSALLREIQRRASAPPAWSA